MGVNHGLEDCILRVTSGFSQKPQNLMKILKLNTMAFYKQPLAPIAPIFQPKQKAPFALKIQLNQNWLIQMLKTRH